MRVDEVCGLAVLLRGPGTVAASGRDHRQPFESIMHVGRAFEEPVRGAVNTEGRIRPRRHYLIGRNSTATA